MIIYNSRKLSVITHRNFDMEELVDVKISQRFLIFCAVGMFCIICID